MILPVLSVTDRNVVTKYCIKVTGGQDGSSSELVTWYNRCSSNSIGGEPQQANRVFLTCGELNTQKSDCPSENMNAPHIYTHITENISTLNFDNWDYFNNTIFINFFFFYFSLISMNKMTRNEWRFVVGWSSITIHTSNLFWRNTLVEALWHQQRKSNTSVSNHKPALFSHGSL